MFRVRILRPLCEVEKGEVYSIGRSKMLHGLCWRDKKFGTRAGGCDVSYDRYVVLIRDRGVHFTKFSWG